MPAPPIVSPPPGTTDVRDFVGIDGIFTKTAVATSVDGKCKLTLAEGVKGLTGEGRPLTQITVMQMGAPPAPPQNSSIMGYAYDLGPNGTSFTPPITLVFNYDESLIPGGVAEKNLVIAMTDEAATKWNALNSTVSQENNTITTNVSHFTAFAILAYTRPATLAASDLTISPTEVNRGETVTISVIVANSGDLSGSSNVTLKIDGTAVATKEVTLGGGASQKVTFTTTKDAAGTYIADVSGLTSTFTVKALSAPPPPPKAAVNWWPIFGIIAGVMVLIMVIVLVARQRRA